jgi:tetratricopeptide (TPR) repeat protein
VDQATKTALKQPDPFVATTTSGLEWASANRKQVIVTAAVLLVLIVLAVAGGVVWSQRSQAAADAFGLAMETYQAPVTQPGQPPLPGVKSYASLAERGKAANQLFRQVAEQYGGTRDGRNALYFEGVTYMDMGQTQSAETALKQASSVWDSELASLAKLSLAGLYRQSGRDAQAIDLYKQLTDHPTDTVPAGLAQLQLAELYEAEGKPAQAKEIYAHLKDADKNAKGKPGIVSEVAGEKLNPKAAAQQPGQ